MKLRVTSSRNKWPRLRRKFSINKNVKGFILKLRWISKLKKWWLRNLFNGMIFFSTLIYQVILRFKYKISSFKTLKVRLLEPFSIYIHLSHFFMVDSTGQQDQKGFHVFRIWDLLQLFYQELYQNLENSENTI